MPSKTNVINKVMRSLIKILFPVITVLVIVFSVPFLEPRSIWNALGIFTLITVVGSFISVRNTNSILTINCAATFSAILLYGIPMGIWTSIIEVTLLGFIYRIPPLKLLYNLSIISLCVLIVGLAQYLFITLHIPSIVADVILLIFYFYVNVTVCATMFYGLQGAPWKHVFKQIVRGNTLTFLLILGVGLFSALVAKVYGGLSIVPIVGIFLIISTVFKQYYASVKKLEGKVEEVKKLNTSLITTMAFSIEARDPYTSGHSWRVAEWGKEIAATMKLSQKQIDEVYFGGILHDIGKIGIEDSILGKPDRLTYEEFEKVKQHPVIGYNILKQAGIFDELLPAIRSHHERVDGTGYPDGLQNEKIPLMARILAVSDAFDAMVSDRPYRKGLSKEEAINRIRQGAGTQFDEEIANVFIQLIEERDIEIMKARHIEDFTSAFREAASAAAMGKEER